jgi:hypothetical protein
MSEALTREEEEEPRIGKANMKAVVVEFIVRLVNQHFVCRESKG